MVCDRACESALVTRAWALQREDAGQLGGSPVLGRRSVTCGADIVGNAARGLDGRERCSTLR
eukprot:1928081-Rhodomonas_salina.4